MRLLAASAVLAASFFNSVDAYLGIARLSAASQMKLRTIAVKQPGSTHLSLFPISQVATNDALTSQLNSSPTIRVPKVKHILSSIRRSCKPILFALSIAVLFTVAPVQAREQGIQILAKAKKSQPLSNAGETGSEMKQLLYSLSQFGALAGFALIAWIYQSFKEMKEKKMFTTEVEKIKEAKIEMYFDAVSEILSKLDDPKAKGSMKATLLKELKVLDPDGTMVKFLKGKGPKPDIWDRINTPKKKSAKPLKRRKKKKPQSAQASENTATSDSTMRNDNNTPRPAETQAEGAESSVFRDLLSSLKRSMPEDSANKIVQYLQTRMGGISDEAKRTTALSKIAARIDDKDYWVDLGGKIGAL